MRILPHTQKLTNIEPGCFTISSGLWLYSCQHLTGTASSLVPSHLCPGLPLRATWSCSTLPQGKPKSSPQPTRPAPTSLSPPFLPLLPLSPLLILLHTHRSPSSVPSNMVPAEGLCIAMPAAWAPPQPGCCLCPTLDPYSHLSPGLQRASCLFPSPHPPSHCACHMHSTLYCPPPCMTEATQGQVWTPASLRPCCPRQGSSQDVPVLGICSLQEPHLVSCRTPGSHLRAHPVSQPQPGCFLPPHLTLSCH